MSNPAGAGASRILDRLPMSSAVAREGGFIPAWNARTPILVEQSNSIRLASCFADRTWSPLVRVGGLLTVAWKSRRVACGHPVLSSVFALRAEA